MGKSSQTTTSSQTQTNAIDPRYDNKNWSLFGNLENATSGYTPVPAPNVLPYNPAQIEAQNSLLGIGRSGVDPYTQSAGDTYGRLANYNPMLVTANMTSQVAAPTQAINRSSIQNVGYNPFAAASVDGSSIGNVQAQNAAAAQMTAAGLQNYVGMMDPSYQNAVLGQAQNDIERNRQITQNAGAAAAAAAGAFGGSRHGVADAETNRAYGDTFARTAADLRLQGYQQALGNYQQDLGRQQQVGMFNSDAALRAGMANQGTQAQIAAQNAQLAQQAGLANSQGSLQAALANQGIDAQVAAANADAQNRSNLFNANLYQNAQQFNSNQLMNEHQFNSGQLLNAAQLQGQAANGLLGYGNNLLNQGIQKAGLIDYVGGQNYDLANQQQQIDYYNQQLQANQPIQNAMSLLGAFNGLPYGTTSTGNGTSTTVQRPSLLSQIGQGLSLGANFIPGVGAFSGMTRGLLGGGGGMSSLPLTSNLGGSGFDPLGSRLNRYGGY
jgi:hypothetical protein